MHTDSVSAAHSPVDRVTYRLRPPAPAGPPIELTDEQEQVVHNVRSRLRVLAGPGTGKTATLVEAVAERISSGRCAPAEILVLTFSRRAAAELSHRIAGRIGMITREPVVRTLHSYAYALVRAQSSRAGEPSPRLLDAGESDQMVRELLAGHREDGGGPWPKFLLGALDSPAFAGELRDLLLRAAERGLDPGRITALGRRAQRPEWQAVGAFAREFQQVGDLRQGSSGFGTALDQAELTAAALGALADDDALAAEQRRIRRIFVDEYQDVDPAQARLIDRLASGADELVVVGDPDQSIYAFRGSDPSALKDISVDATVTLTCSRRLPPVVLDATRRVARLLPGPARHRDLTSPGPPPGWTGELTVTVLSGPAQESSYLADRLRRAHLLDGVPWSSMAVLFRSPAASLPALTRALSAAGVPAVIARGDQVLAADPVVAALLTVLRCGIDPSALTANAALELLRSPLAGLDALALRRLRRALRTATFGQGTSTDLVAALLTGAPLRASVPVDLAAPVTRIVDLVATARHHAATASAEELLWTLWRRSGVEPTLVATAERGGRAGLRADRTLDAVIGLFAAASELAERLPLAGVEVFVETVQGQQIPGDPDRPAIRSGGAVSLLSAHAAKGLEWEVVAIAGVQEGSWPDLRMRGDLLHTDELLDTAAGLPPTDGRLAALLAEERRLFYVAATRARRSLICTAVSGQDTVPSRFLGELAGATDDLPVLPPTPRPDPSHRNLHVVDLVSDLRRAVAEPTAPVAAAAAARQLARLAAAGVPGAHPDDWYGLAEPSSDAPPVRAGDPVRVSPSTVEALTTCALRAVLEKRGGSGGEPSQAQIEGIVVHALANGLATGVPDAALREEITDFINRQQHLPPWQLARTGRVLNTMLEAARQWVASNHPPRRLLGSELEMDVMLPPGEPAEHPVRLTGRVDWLSELPDGRLMITDFKTGASRPTKAEAEAHPQLATYQSAVGLGAFRSAADRAEDGPGEPPALAGGGELVFLRTGTPKVLAQSALDAAGRQHWLGTIRSAAQHLASAAVWAEQNGRCDRCPVRTSCPIQSSGRQVTR